MAAREGFRGQEGEGPSTTSTTHPERHHQRFEYGSCLVPSQHEDVYPSARNFFSFFSCLLFSRHRERRSRRRYTPFCMAADLVHYLFLLVHYNNVRFLFVVSHDPEMKSATCSVS